MQTPSINNLEHQLLEQRQSAKDFFWHKLRWRALSQYLPRVEPMHLLDFGAGSGLFYHIAQSERPTVKYSFAEISTVLRPALLKEHGAQADLTTSSAFTGIHAVVSLDVMEHVENDRAFLESIISRSPSGTTIIIAVPSHMFLWSRWDVLVGHLRRYNKRDLLTLAQNFTQTTDLVSCHYIFWELFPLALYRKLKLSLVPPKNEANESEVPKLSTFINNILYCYGRMAMPFCKFMPFGTSALLVLRKL